MIPLRLLACLCFGVVALCSTSCGLLVEAAVTGSREAKKLTPGSTLESRSFTVKVPNDSVYIKSFDKSKEVLVLADTSSEALGNEYYAFPIEANAGEPPSSALLRHYAKHSPRERWQVIATGSGKVRGSAGQVDLITQRNADGGFLLVSECIRSGNRMWVVAHLFRYPGEWGPDRRSLQPWMHGRLAPFARSFRRK